VTVPYNYTGGPFATTQPSFALFGGEYGITRAGNWGGGSVTLNIQASNGSWVPALAAAWTANGFQTATLPGGTYQLAVASTATSTYVSISRIPR
jgi:hypothetical protein